MNQKFMHKIIRLETILIYEIKNKKDMVEIFSYQIKHPYY